MPTHRSCPTCISIGRKKPNTIKYVHAVRCGQCYRERQDMPSLALPESTCVECGESCRRGSQRCAVCWNKRIGLPNAKRDKIEKQVALAAAATIREPLTTFEEGWTRWQETIGMMRDRYKGPAKPRKSSSRKRILVIPDLHIPFHEPEMIADMMVREAKQTDIAVLIGDVGDAYSLSRYQKYESVPYDYEWAQVTVMMQSFSEAFPDVRVIVGNHDARLRKAIANHLSADMVEAITTMTGGTLCPITALARKFENITIAKHPIPNTEMTVDWLMVIGDAVLAHPEKYSRVPGSALRAFEEWCSDGALSMGLDSIRLLVMGHTHTLSMIPWRSNKLLVECGCLCKTQSYMTGARIGGRPQRRGYLWFEQEDGVTDLNSVGWHWYDAQKD